MKIIIAENAGLCFGVKRAIDMTDKELSTSNNTYSLGPLIHNQQAVKKLEERGLKTVKSIEDIEDGNIIIRSHGVKKSVIENINSLNLNLVDTTCPYVKSVHRKVEEFYEQGYNIVIIGDSNHPEVIGINGWCNNTALIINSEDEAKNIQNMDKICIVSQTTNTKSKFETISNIIKKNNNDVEIYNTICNATNLRQTSCKDVASKVDAMIVIGGYHSANTNKLVEIAKKYCKYVYHIETASELPLQSLSKFNIIGVTAGASTPDWIIKEVVETVDNINNKANNETNTEMDNEMMEAIENSFTRIHRGEILKGEVLFVTDNEVMVNINYKSDGIVTREELSSDPDVRPRDLYQVGDEIQVYVIKIDDGDGNVVLSTKRVEDGKSWDELQETFNNEETIECKILNSVKGGLAVLVNGINGFMPASHVSTRYVSDLNEYKGKKLVSKIIDFDKDKKRIILSRKEVEQEELEKKKAALWEKLKVDDLVDGVVQRLTDFGAFVDLDGLDGLIHISDLSWNRVKHPSEVVKINQNVTVKVLALDKERNRISLGLKQTTEEPWKAFSNNVQVGDIVDGTVVNLLDFGAFVRLDTGVDGLLHVSQISNEHINKPSDVLNIGDKIKVKVINIDEENKRISLSTKEDVSEIKQPETHLEDEEEITIGDMID